MAWSPTNTNSATVSVDTVGNPDDTTVVAAPTKGTIFIHWVLFNITTVDASGMWALEDGVGGTVKLQQSTATAGTYLFSFPDAPMQLTSETLLNITNTGGTSAVGTCSVGYSVR